ncbi:hypothetical protein BC624_105142 [Flavobacterium granuli]|uniref:Transposase n=1 Tax=Flavobacterium granuli TaxID=280093 RepID=A0A1M5NW52_9FLAO|nr:hypothetical protein BC624_105142 [Flavobacterium granuli]SHG93814.1 hypothetical protein SAMN05443373_105142 [Flavobacterium granuli]
MQQLHKMYDKAIKVKAVQLGYEKTSALLVSN